MEVAELVVVLKEKLDRVSADKAAQEMAQSLNANLDKVTDKFTNGLSRALGGIDLSGFSNSMLAGAAGFAALLDIGKFAVGSSIEMAHLGQEIAWSADKAEIARDKFQLYSQAAKESSVNSHQFVLAMKMMNKNIYQAITKPTGEAATSFKAMGVATTDMSGKIRQTDAVLGDLMDQFAGMEETPARAALATKIFGIRGHEMIPFLIKGRAYLTELKGAMEEYNATISAESIKNSEDFTKATMRLDLAWMGFKNSLSELGIIKVITFLMEKATDVVVWFSKGLRQMRDYTEEGHGAALILEIALGSLAAAALYFSGVLIGAMLPALLSIAGAVIAATWPFLLIGAAIGLVVDDFVAFIDGGDSVLGTIVDFMKGPSDFPLFEVFKSFFNALFDMFNPAVWTRFWTSIKSFFLDPLFAALDILDAVWSKLFGSTISQKLITRADVGVGADSGNMTKAALSALTPGSETIKSAFAAPEAKYSGYLSPAATPGFAAGAKEITQSNKFDVTINATTNASPDDIAHAVQKTHEQLMSDAHAQIQQGSH